LNNLKWGPPNYPVGEGIVFQLFGMIVLFGEFWIDRYSWLARVLYNPSMMKKMVKEKFV